jgi:hypothetical protein
LWYSLFRLLCWFEKWFRPTIFKFRDVVETGWGRFVLLFDLYHGVNHYFMTHAPPWVLRYMHLYADFAYL